MNKASYYLVALVVFGLAVATALTGGLGCPVLLFLLLALALVIGAFGDGG